MTIALAISAMGGAAAYVALAALGWGGPGPLFSHPALIAAAAVMFALAVWGVIAPGANLSPGVREDRSNRWVLAVFAILGMLNGWLPAFTDRHNLWTLDGDAMRWLGVVLLAGGGALRIWPIYVLGNRFSGLVAIQPGHTLVTTRIYSMIRHPSYLGLLVNSIGWSLAFRSIPGVIVTALFLLPLVARMNAEEKLLLDQFDGEYEAYRKRTSRLIPGLY